MSLTKDCGDAAASDSASTRSLTKEDVLSYHKEANSLLCKNQEDEKTKQLLPGLILEDSEKQPAGAPADNATSLGAEVLVDKTQQFGSALKDRIVPDPELGTRAVAALNEIADNPSLLRRISQDGVSISRKDLQTALVLDSRVRAKDGPAPYGPDHLLTDNETKAVKYLHDNWSNIVGREGRSIDVKQFSSDLLNRNSDYSVVEAIKNVAKGAPIDDVASAVKNLDPATKARLSDLVAQNVKETSSNKEQESVYSDRINKLDPSQVKEVSDELFDRIDKDKDGHLSKSELGQAMEDQQFTGQEAQVVAALHKNREALEELSDDEWFDENDGITRKDLQKFDEMEADRSKRTDAVYDGEDWTDKRFKSFDKNGDGLLSSDEVDNALKQKDGLTDQDKRILAHLKEKYNEIKNESNDQIFAESSISQKDIKEYTAKWMRDGDVAKLVGDVDWNMYRTSQNQVDGYSKELFANKEDPVKSVTPDAIKQGTIGDCYLESSLAAVANQDPESIVKMIKDNGDGTYTVTFPGDPKHPVTVKAPTEAEMGLYNYGSKDGAWACVMEKAYGKYLQQYKGHGGATPAEGADGGGYAEDPLELLTAKNYSRKDISDMSQKQLVKELTDAFAEGNEEPIEASVSGDKGKGKGGTSVDGFPTHHSYTVVGFKPDGNGGGTVIIRNPWGGADGTTSGTIEMPLDKFVRNFSELTYFKD
ncbi:MAG TPA: C2 family cysteine protease [Candidatus Obscuribacterales bacterium]